MVYIKKINRPWHRFYIRMQFLIFRRIFRSQYKGDEEVKVESYWVEIISLIFLQKRLNFNVQKVSDYLLVPFFRKLCFSHLKLAVYLKSSVALVHFNKFLKNSNFLLLKIQQIGEIDYQKSKVIFFWISLIRILKSLLAIIKQVLSTSSFRYKNVNLTLRFNFKSYPIFQILLNNNN